MLVKMNSCSDQFKHSISNFFILFVFLWVTDEEDEDKLLRNRIREEADKDPLADFYRDPASEINAECSTSFQLILNQCRTN